MAGCCGRGGTATTLSTIQGLIQAGENITIEGAGTQSSPYVVGAVPDPASSIDGLVTAGQNITITGSGTPEDPYVISATPAPLPPAGDPVALTMVAPATTMGGITATRNPDGSVSLGGIFQVPGPWVAGNNSIHFSALPYGWAPTESEAHVAGVVATGNYSFYTTRIDINPAPVGDLFVWAPDMVEGDTLDVYLDAVTFWPAPGGGI